MMRVPSLRQGKGELYIQKLNSHNAQTIAGVEHSGARCRVTHPNDESTASPVQAKRRRASLLYAKFEKEGSATRGRRNMRNSETTSKSGSCKRYRHGSETTSGHQAR